MPPELVDWSVARRVGRSVAGDGIKVDRAEAARIADEFRAHVEHASSLVAEYSGLESAEPVGSTLVMGRGAWIDANVDALRRLTLPLSERIAEGLRSPGPRKLGGLLVGFQLGTLLGYVSRKVLGQYDLLLATDEPGRVYFVGPNILATEQRSGLDPADFRLWIALHEVTHRTQFTAVPWLRPHVESLIGRYLDGITVDAQRLKELSRRLRQTIAGGPDAWRNANLMSVFLSGEQKEAVDEMQSLMSVIEGHGNFVMDGIAATQVPSFPALKSALQSRRAAAGAAERAFQKMIALDMKMAQYRVGQAFFDEVARLGGMDAVNLVWSGPENLPTQQELDDVPSWLGRVQPQPTLFAVGDPSTPP